MTFWELAAIVSVIWLALHLWHRSRRPIDIQGPLIHPEVNTDEFSRLFARVLADERCRKLLVPLLEASGNNITRREMAILKYLSGEEDRDFLVHALEEMAQDNTTQDAIIADRQMDILKSVFESQSTLSD